MPAYFGPVEAARYLGISRQYLCEIRHTADFPPATYLGRRPKWSQADLDAYMRLKREVKPKGITAEIEAEAAAIVRSSM